MIMIECCGSCKYWQDDRCMNRDSFCVDVTADDCCEEWNGDGVEDDNE